jgi:hypothetical protein
MEKEFVPYEQALALKELGFDETNFECFKHWVHYGDYNYFLILPKPKNSYDYISAPLYQQAFRWFREKYQIECHIKSLYEQRENKGFYFGLDDYKSRDFYSKTYVSYEEAELECLRKLIEIVKDYV